MAPNQICRNCGHKVDDNYCPSCGQRTNTDRLTWMTFAESFTSTFIGDEAYGLRGINMRQGAVMTWVSMLCRPTRTISEFIQGHRRKYFNPVAILLLLSTFYAVVFGLVGKEFIPKVQEGQSFATWLIYSYYDYARLHPAANMLMLLPFYALALKSVFRKKTDLKYVEYLYVGIFISVFEITLMIIGLPAELLFSWYSAFYIQTLPVFIYSVFIFWKLFNLSKRGAILRTFTANILQYIYLTLIAMVALILAVGVYGLTTSDEKKEKDLKELVGSGNAEKIIEKDGLGEVINVVIDLITGGDDDEAADETEKSNPAYEETIGHTQETVGTQKKPALEKKETRQEPLPRGSGTEVVAE